VPQPQNMIYTSGTTGNPKGVRRSAPTPEQVISAERLRALIYGLKPGVRALLPGPLYHSAPNSFGLRAGRLGGALVLMPRFDADEFLRLVEAEKIDTIFIVPTMFVRLLKLPQSVREKYDTSSLRHVVHAAAPCPADVKRAMLDWWGPVISEYYGSTEASALTYATAADSLKRPGTVGKILDGVELRFLGDHGEALPQGEIGEIYSRTPDTPDFTYHNNPDKRAEVERDGFITSGDVGYIDADGYVFLRDRKRDMVISGGVNIYPRDRGGAARCSRRARLRRVRDPRCGIWRGAAGGGGTAGWRSSRRRRHPQAAEGLAGRLQSAETHRNRAKPAARRFRQDLQASPARSLLGAGAAEDLGARTWDFCFRRH